MEDKYKLLEKRKVFEELEKNKIKFDKISKINKGKNSNCFCIFTNKKKLFLKLYPEHDFLNRDRLNAEVSFLKLLHEGGFNNIPKIIFINKKQKWILLSWLDGELISEIKNIHVKNLFIFIKDIQLLKNSSFYQRIGPASEAKFSIIKH